MDKLKVLSLFSGIGAFEKALTNIKIPYDIVNYCEIDKNAAKCYSVIHNVPESKNLVDITKVDEKKLDKNIDLIVHGSPCFTGNTKILMSGGFLKPISEIKVGEKISYNGGSYEVLNFWNQGFKKIIKLIFVDGTIITCTPNHKFLCVGECGDEWVEAKDLVTIIDNNFQEIRQIRKDNGKTTYVVNVVDIKEKQEVFDIEVDKVHLFVLENGSIAHNCQDYSLAGKEKGGDEGSGTRSSLLWDSVRIIKEVKPKYIVWENVKNVLGPKHIHNFQKYLDTLEKEGYKNYYKVLNAKNFKLPQSRERIFVVSIREDIENDFDFKNIKESKKIVPIKNKCFDMSKIEDKYICKRPLILATSAKNRNDIITIGEVSKNSQGGKVYGIDGVFPTICAGVHGYAMGYIYQDSKVRMITPEEVFIFMGFTKKDCKKCRDINMKDTPLYKMGGNSIAVSVLEAIFKELVNNPDLTLCV